MARTQHRAFTPPIDQRPPDMPDAEEYRVVASTLEALPAEHQARKGFAEGASTIELTHLDADRPDLVEALTEAFLAGYRRSLERWGRHFRP